MPARDIYHNAVRRALEKDGWTITDDPLHLEWGRTDIYVDLGAEQLIGAEKASQKIAVEIKSFRSASEMRDLEQAVGQFVIYRMALAQGKPEFVLYLAVPQDVIDSIFEERPGRLLIEDCALRLIGYDHLEERITAWKP
jgi:hypothetical protein